jgi:hypothetical protein
MKRRYTAATRRKNGRERENVFQANKNLFATNQTPNAVNRQEMIVPGTDNEQRVKERKEGKKGKRERNRPAYIRIVGKFLNTPRFFRQNPTTEGNQKKRQWTKMTRRKPDSSMIA